MGPAAGRARTPSAGGMGMGAKSGGGMEGGAAGDGGGWGGGGGGGGGGEERGEMGDPRAQMLLALRLTVWPRHARVGRTERLTPPPLPGLEAGCGCRSTRPCYVFFFITLKPRVE